MKYRREGQVVDAFRWTEGGSDEQEPKWATETARIELMGAGTPRAFMRIETPAGERTARRGDWIVRDSNGHISTCKHEMFAAMYEPIVA